MVRGGPARSQLVVITPDIQVFLPADWTGPGESPAPLIISRIHGRMNNTLESDIVQEVGPELNNIM